MAIYLKFLCRSHCLVSCHAAFYGSNSNNNDAYVVRLPFNATSGAFLNVSADYIGVGGNNNNNNSATPATHLVALTAMAVDRGGTLATIVTIPDYSFDPYATEMNSSTDSTQLYQATLTSATAQRHLQGNQRRHDSESIQQQ